MTPNELNQYQHAAEQVCVRLGESPHQMRMDENGQPVPLWMIIAAKMHKLRLMLDAMRLAGMTL